ncbi:protoporphyrinogen/coproporphyrinogen oxidase [Microbacterium sp. JB110]|uniref:protoporphyrinogen/coproporphyrinogen oxidase n=1 Tax=Microbacterium sp. JB110 TaxID=2024477 RepID=UPI00097F36F0|nr:FAD-dependent oxidoreductase [Microbacterium sp. JB110]RCS57298.1 protoporphyrinogen oxidase [Microbacterium sp. JB110]SJM58436.1 Protoporphyrinogen IX oxidase, aerobic, HemY [Frigoribacterium sp. JB110]
MAERTAPAGETDLAELRRRAAGIRVAVIGAGAAGLVAARELAGVGFAVDVYEAADTPGGAVRTAEVAGVRLDLGAESFATRGGHVRALIDELGLGGDVVEPGTGAGGAWLAGLPGGRTAPLPKGGILGIPATPFTADVRRIIGWGGAWRAYLVDTFKPVLTIGHAASLGKLVRSRLGGAIADRLVAPVTSGVYSADPDDIDPEVAAPGLGAAITKMGRLFSAVDRLQRERREVAKAPGSAVQGITGGMGRLIDALVDDLATHSVTFRTATQVERLEHDGAWRVVTNAVAREHPDAAPLDPDAVDLDAPEGADDRDDETDDPAYDAVFVATDEGTARRLLAPHVEGLAPAPSHDGPSVAVATLVLDAPQLDAAPRGTGVLTVPGSFRAKALTHVTAKWAWVGDALGGSRHVVRVSFGAQGEAPATDELSEDEAAQLALEQASAMLGAELAREQLVDIRIERFAQSQPAATIGRRSAVEAARSSVIAVDGLGVAGAWVAGTGLAQVVPDAVAEADRLRHAVLWRGDDS